MTEVQPVTDLIPVQALELPELPTPFVDAASAQLISPRVAQPALPVKLAPPEPVAANEEPAPAFAPKPLTPVAGEPTSSASSEDLEGMLQGMAWVTGTLGLGAVLSLWMLRTWLTRGGRMISTSKSLKLIETLRVGPRCGLYLVQAESHRVLVGVEHGKSMCLMPLPSSFTESLDDATSDDQAAPPPAAGFERIADVFAALRKTDERAKGATS
jgi:flagellar biogenesis protein FliO